MEVAAITAGPVKNLTAIENVATDFPQAMIFGCKAMNKPETRKRKRKRELWMDTRKISVFKFYILQYLGGQSANSRYT